MAVRLGARRSGAHQVLSSLPVAAVRANIGQVPLLSFLLSSSSSLVATANLILILPR